MTDPTFSVPLDKLVELWHFGPDPSWRAVCQFAAAAPDESCLYAFCETNEDAVAAAVQHLTDVHGIQAANQLESDLADADAALTRERERHDLQVQRLTAELERLSELNDRMRKAS